MDKNRKELKTIMGWEQIRREKPGVDEGGKLDVKAMTFGRNNGLPGICNETELNYYLRCWHGRDSSGHKHTIEQKKKLIKKWVSIVRKTLGEPEAHTIINGYVCKYIFPAPGDQSINRTSME